MRLEVTEDSPKELYGPCHEPEAREARVGCHRFPEIDHSAWREMP